MNQTVHIINKDGRRLRRAIGAWGLIVAAAAALMVARPAFDLQGFGMAMVMGQLTSLVSLIELVMMVLIVSWLVHEDPAVDREAFWLTRPISPSRLSMAKITVASVALVGVPLIGQFVVMRIFAVNIYDMARATPSIALTQAAWVMALLAAAALTPSLTRYATVLVGAAGAFVLLVSTMIASVVLFADVSRPSARPVAIDPLPALITTVMVIAVSLGVVFFEYRYRRVKWGAVIASTGVLVIAVWPMIWPSHLRQLPDPDPGPWAQDQARVAPRVGSEPPYVSDEPDFVRRGESKKRIAIPLELAGLPDDVYVQGVQAHSRFEVSNGTVVSTAAEMVPFRRRENSDSSARGQFSALQGALGRTVLRERGSLEQQALWPVVLDLTDQEFARFGHAPGRLTSTLDFYLARATVAGIVPLEAGQALKDDGRRIEVVHIDRRADGCTLNLRTISVGPALHPRFFSRDEFVLRNAGRGEAIYGSPESYGSHSSSPMGFLVAVAFGGGYSDGANPDAPGFSVTAGRYRFPASVPSSGQTAGIDSAWLAAAELVRINIAYAGHVTRSLTIDNFRMAQ